jgi:hypothetical protein
LKHAGQLLANLVLLMRREDRDNTINRFGRIQRVQRREHEMARLGRDQRGLDRVHVAHFADQNHVGVLTQGRAKTGRVLRRIEADLALCDHREAVVVHEFDRVLDRDDVQCARAVDEIHHRGERRALARAGRAGQKNEAA